MHMCYNYNDPAMYILQVLLLRIMNSWKLHTSCIDNNIPGMVIWIKETTIYTRYRKRSGKFIF